MMGANMMGANMMGNMMGGNMVGGNMMGGEGNHNILAMMEKIKRLEEKLNASEKDE